MPQPSMSQHLSAGILGGSVSTVLLYPLELVKTRMQVIESSGTTMQSRGYHSMHSATRTVLAKEGFLGLYQGLFPAVIASAGSWGFYFLLYENSKQRKLRSFENGTKLSTIDHLLSGVEAGVVLVLAFNPLWLVKTRLALQGIDTTRGKPYSGLFQSLKMIVKEEGFVGLYKGVVPALFLTSHGAIQFAFYEKLKEFSSNYYRTNSTSDSNVLPSWVPIINGGISKIFASTVTYPYQVIKSRLQQRPNMEAPPTNGALLSKLHSNSKYSGTIDCIQKIWKVEGVRGYFRGVMPNALKVAPSAALTFFTYEETLKLLQTHNLLE